MANEFSEVLNEPRSEGHFNSADRVVILSPLRRSEKTRLGKISNRASDAMTKLATRDIKIKKDLRTIDFRPDADDVNLQRQQLEEELRSHIDQGEQVAVIGSSAGGQEALRLAKKLELRAISNQGRLAEGTSEHHPTLDEAARNHPEFEKVVPDFEQNVAPQITNHPNPELFLTIGAEKDSVVPRDLKSLSGVTHIEIDRPKGILGLASKIPGIDHAVAIYKGLRHPALRKHIKGNY